MSRVQPKQPPNIFQYTNNVGPLTIEQRAFYEENGFLIVRSVFDRNELEPIAKHYFDKLGLFAEPKGIIVSLKNKVSLGFRSLSL